MSIETVKSYFKKFQRETEILEFDISTASVELAGIALHVAPKRIAKSLSFKNKNGGAVLIVMAGDTRIDNAKFKQFFGFKAKMLETDEVETLTGHAVGGVCPFANPVGLQKYLDQSLKRFTTVFPACGNASSAIELNLDELEKYAESQSWIDVGKDWD